MKTGLIRKSDDKSEEINMAPLIDMIFILLIFFMVTSTFVKDLEIEIDRPGAASAVQADMRAVRIAIDRTGRVLFDGQTIQPWMVQSRIREIVKDQPDKPVLVVADEKVETGRLVEVVDECRLAGAKHVGVDVERK